jgi:hypothetical protein
MVFKDETMCMRCVEACWVWMGDFTSRTGVDVWPQLRESDSKMVSRNFIMSISGAYFLAEHGYAYLVLPKEVFCSKTKQWEPSFQHCGLPVNAAVFRLY